MKSLIIVLLLICQSAFALSGQVRVSVQPTDKSEFKGLFWNQVDETVGDGPSPTVVHEDVMAAIRSEFVDPSAAMARLEELKGPGGQIVVDFFYQGRSTERPEGNGDLMHRCGVIGSGNDGPSSLYAEWSNGITSGGEEEGLRRYADSGKFFQFKWASRAQIRRFIARCFARLPGMPPLRNHRPRARPTLYIPNEIYQDLHGWMRSIPGVGNYKYNHPKFKNAAKCLISNASNYIPDRTGNIVVMQRQKNKKRRRTRTNRRTVVSEMGNLPSHLGIQRTEGNNDYDYSIAFMDHHSAGQLRSHWEGDTIQTSGVWPNFQGSSVASVLAQVYGNEFVVNIKACLLSAGIQVPNANEVLPTIYNPFTCREIDQSSINVNEHLNILCENGSGLSCYFIGAAFHHGKRFSCLPQDLGGRCLLGDGQRDIKKAMEFYKKACDLRLAAACVVLGDMQELPRPDFLPVGNINPHYLRACEIQDSPSCRYYRLGLQVVTSGNLPAFESACNQSLNQKEACSSLGIYYLSQGNRSRAREVFTRGCNAPGFARKSSPCIQLANMELEDGNRSRAVEILSQECSFVRKIGCRELYEIYQQDGNQQAMDKLVRRLCWNNNNQICF